MCSGEGIGHKKEEGKDEERRRNRRRNAVWRKFTDYNSGMQHALPDNTGSRWPDGKWTFGL
jgi:hypothetical protein